MRKTLGDYNIEKSSSTDVNNINWSQKKVNDGKKPKKKKILKTNQISSGTNIIFKILTSMKYIVGGLMT